MDVITELNDLTEKIYQVDVSHNLQTNDSGLIFVSNDYFDWFAEGVFIYQPELEGEKGVKYLQISPSDLYEFDGSNETAQIFIRSDYHMVLSKYYKNYNIVDVEHEGEDKDNYIFTDFVVYRPLKS